MEIKTINRKLPSFSAVPKPRNETLFKPKKPSSLLKKIINNILIAVTDFKPSSQFYYDKHF